MTWWCAVVAFAELQTEVTDFTSDLSVVGIPVWDYQTYASLVLFPTVGSGTSNLLSNGKVCTLMIILNFIIASLDNMSGVELDLSRLRMQQTVMDFGQVISWDAVE